MDRYITALRPLLPQGVGRIFRSVPIASVIAPKGEEWDLVAINRYPTLEGFREMLESREYRERALPHREAGLEECRLVMLDKME